MKTSIFPNCCASLVLAISILRAAAFGSQTLQNAETACFPLKMPGFTYWDCKIGECCVQQGRNAQIKLTGKTELQLWSNFHHTNESAKLVQKARSRLVVRSVPADPSQESAFRLFDTQLTLEEDSSLTFEFLGHTDERLTLPLPKTMEVTGDALVQIITDTPDMVGVGYWDKYSRLRMTGTSTLIIGGWMTHFEIATSRGSVHIDSGTLKLADRKETGMKYRFFIVKQQLVIEPEAILEVLNMECCIVDAPTVIPKGKKISISSVGSVKGIACFPPAVYRGPCSLEDAHS